jgi:endonuclease/exonuclease/phosphatase family metal-dependent hydrolase
MESIIGIHKAQIITYLKLLRLKRGYILNFNSPLIKTGIHRISIWVSPVVPVFTVVNKMRIVTWNIRGGLGMDGVRSLDRIADTLREFNADVICLQEVHQRFPFGGMQNQPSKLARELEMNCAFSSAMRFYSGFGNVILSRWPIRNVQVIDLPNRAERKRPGLWFERRILQYVQVSADGHDITLFNTHWSLDPLDRTAASEQISGLIAGIRGPVILCGDLNASRDSIEVSNLSAAGLVDAAGGTGDPTYPADHPRIRIDYIWSRGFQVESVQTMSSHASDHFPVVVDLSLETASSVAPSGSKEMRSNEEDGEW